MRLLARFGFEDLGLQRLEILVAVENIASQRAAEKTGARYQGLQPNRILVGGSLYEAVRYSLIPAGLGTDAGGCDFIAMSQCSWIMPLSTRTMSNQFHL